MFPSARHSSAVLLAVHARPGITRAELARELGISTGVANDTVGRLQAERLLTEGDPIVTGSRGRPTRPLGPHPDGPVVLVAAIGHNDWEVAVAGLGGAPVTLARAGHARDRHVVLPAVAGALADGAAAYGSRVLAAAVSVPGTVVGERLVQASPLGWEDVALGGLAPAHLRLLAGNDASFSALAEARRGAAVGVASTLHLFIGSGVGGAVIDHDHVVTGATGRAGEFGHMPLGRRGATCRCGATGCWNTALDGSAFAHALREPAPADDIAYARDVFARARAGGMAERRAVRAVAAAFGRGAAAVATALDPALVTAGGLASDLLALAGDRARAAYRAGLMPSLATAPPPLVAATLGDRAPLIGAAEHALAATLLATS